MHPWSGAPDAKIVFFSSVGGSPDKKIAKIFLNCHPCSDTLDAKIVFICHP